MLLVYSFVVLGGRVVFIMVSCFLRLLNRLLDAANDLFLVVVAAVLVVVFMFSDYCIIAFYL